MHYILILLFLTSCGAQARLVIIDGQLSTTGWKSEDVKDTNNVSTGTVAINSGNQSSLKTRDSNIVSEEETYEQIHQELIKSR